MRRAPIEMRHGPTRPRSASGVFVVGDDKVLEPAASPSGNDDFDRARRLLHAKREDEALDSFEVAIDTCDDPRIKASAAAHVAALLLGFGRPWEVAAFAITVRDHGSPALGDMLEAAACVQLGDPLGALQLL